MKKNFLFLGPDAVSKKEAVEKVLKSCGIAPAGDDPRRCLFFASESGADAIFNECATPAFFGDGKAVIVHEAELLPTDKIKDYLADPADSTVLLLLSEKNKGKFSQAVEKLFTEHGEVRMFWEMFEDRLEQWAEKKATQYGMTKVPGLGAQLVERCGRSAQLIEQAIQILANNFGDRPFTLQEAEGIVGTVRETTVFSFVDALFFRKAAPAIAAARELAGEGESPLLFLTMAQRQLELLWRHAAARRTGRPLSAASLGLVETAFRSLSQMAGRWDIPALARAGAILGRLEFQLKSLGGEMQTTALERAIVAVCRA